MLADEERIKSSGPKACQVTVGPQSGFAHSDAFVGDGRDQFHGNFGPNLERAQVAVVHSDDARAGSQRPRELLARVHLDERFHSQFAAERQQLAKNRVSESRNDQQKRIGVRGPCLPNLPRIDNEILRSTGRATAARASRMYFNSP